MKLSRTSRASIAVAAVAGLASVGVVAPSEAATRSTVVIVESNSFSSLNPGTKATNLTINNDVAYLTGASFAYYDDKKNLQRNTVLGSFKVTKNAPKDFQVTYTVNKGRVWSDGTPIDGVDMLLSHVLSSSAYSKAAGLGDPADKATKPAFESLGYGSPYSSHVVGLPKLSADKMSVTIKYDSFQPDWEVLGPGVSPVHALELLAAGKKKLGTAAENAAAKAKFLKDFTSKNTASLKKMGAIWTTGYNTKTVNASTNPLLLVGNGAYKIQSAVADQSVTLVLNPKYNSGPKTSGIKTIVLKMIADGTAAAQALANKEIDIYQGQPTADAVAQLKKIAGVNVIGGVSSCFEHIDLRTGSIDDTDYTGVFAASNNLAKNAKARDLRTAFLLAYPRQEIVDKLVKPINSKAVVVNSAFTLPGQTGYDAIVKGSGVSKFTAGTQADRTAAALKLVQKYYPTASADNPVVPVNLLWGKSSNSRRASEALLVQAAEAKAGFKVTADGNDNWGDDLVSNKYDAQFFAWCPTSTSQTGTNANFQSDGENNYIGYNNPLMDSTLKGLEQKLSPAQITAKYLAAEKLLIADAVTLPIFQHPAATAVNSALKNVKPAPLSPTLVWNFWEWKY